MFHTLYKDFILKLEKSCKVLIFESQMITFQVRNIFGSIRSNYTLNWFTLNKIKIAWVVFENDYLQKKLQKLSSQSCNKKLK